MILIPLFFAAKDPNVEAVAKALADAEPKLHRCWEKAAADDRHVSGHIDLRVCIGKEGKPKKVIVEADSTGNKLAPCVTAIFQAESWAGFADGDEVDIPVDFQEEDQYTVRTEDARVQETPAEKVVYVLTERNVGTPAPMALVTYTTGEQPKAPYRKQAAFAPLKAGTWVGVTSDDGPVAFAPLHLTAPEADHAKPTFRELYVVSGDGALVVDGQTFPLAPGMGVFVPANVTHHLQGKLDAIEFEVRP